MLPAPKSEDSGSKLDSSTQRGGWGLTPSVEDSPRRTGTYTYTYTGEDFYGGGGHRSQEGSWRLPQEGGWCRPQGRG